MKNLLIAIIIVIAGSLTFLLLQRLNVKEVVVDEATGQEEEQFVASGEYLDYARFDPQYYSEGRIVYLLLENNDASMAELDSDINSNMLQIPQDLVIVKTSDDDISTLRSELSLNTNDKIIEIDNSGRVINIYRNISSLSQLLTELGY
jgi:hypothetical protein